MINFEGTLYIILNKDLLKTKRLSHQIVDVLNFWDESVNLQNLKWKMHKHVHVLGDCTKNTTNWNNIWYFFGVK